MKHISLTLNDNEFDKFIHLLKSLKSVKNFQTQEDDSIVVDSLLIEEHKRIVDERLKDHLNNKSKSYSWEDVKLNARNSNKV